MSAAQPCHRAGGQPRTGFGPPLHLHASEDEAFYLIDGAIEVSCGDRQWEAGPGGFVFLPRGIPHSFVVSAGPVRGVGRGSGRSACASPLRPASARSVQGRAVAHGVSLRSDRRLETE